MSRGSFFLAIILIAVFLIIYYHPKEERNAQLPVATTAPAATIGAARGGGGSAPAATTAPIAPVSNTGGVTTSNTFASSAAAGFSARCSNNAAVEEAGDGNISMTSQPSQGYECEFTVQRQATRVWKGVNATLYKDGQQVQKGGNNVPVTLTPGSRYRVVGGLNNGGFALQMNPTP